MGNGLRTAEKGHCPKCTLRGQPIVYGLIREESDQFVRGGCSFQPEFDPEYVCQKCGAEFGHGGRNYQVEFKIMNEYMFDSFNLVQIDRNRLLQLAPILIEARYELLYRGMVQQNIDLMGIQHGWRSFPMTQQFEIYVFWNRGTQLIEFAARFKSHGVAHRHSFILPGKHQWVRAQSVESYQRLFDRARDAPLEAWKLRLADEDPAGNGLENLELLRLTDQADSVSEGQLALSAVKVEDQQLIPAWFDVEQEYAQADA